MSISRWLDQTSSKSSQTFDVVIVGGGIAGLSSAYWLQKQNPGLRMAILERHRIGFGASGRNAGFVTCGSTEHFMKLRDEFGLAKAVEIWRFSEANRELLLKEIIEDEADSVDFKQTGSCTVAPSEEHWARYQIALQQMTESGVDVAAVGADEMERDFGVTQFSGGALYRGDGYVHPIKLLNRMRSRLKNVEILEGTEVFAIDAGGVETADGGAARATGVILRTDKGTISAGKVLVTLNAYLPLLMKDFSSLIVPGRGQIMVTEPLPAFIKGPCYLTKHLCYFRQLPTGELLIGGFRNLSLETENTHTDATTPVIQKALIDFVRERFKYGAQAKVAYQWSGIMGYTPDGQMIIGEIPEMPGVHVMAGCSGHGMGLSFHAGKVLAESVNGAAIPEHLRLDRFRRRSGER